MSVFDTLNLKSRLRRSRITRLPVVTFRHRRVTDADVFLASYPRSGSTWLRYMLGHLILGSPPDFDTFPQVLPRLGRHMTVEGQLPAKGRLIKSHERYAFPYGLRCRRFIYLVRDGRDVAVSHFHWLRRRTGSDVAFTDFLDAFLDGTVDGYGPWHAHVESWLGSGGPPDFAGRSDVLVLRYEDLLLEPHRRLTEVSNFLRLDVDSQQIDAAVVGQRFDSMRHRAEQSSRVRELAARPDVPYIRQGSSGAWSDVFTDLQRAKFEAHAGRVLERFAYALGSASQSAGTERG